VLDLSAMIAEAKFSIYPVLALAVLGLVFMVTPQLYNVINNAAHPGRDQPLVSKLPGRVVGAFLLLVAAVTWFIHRNEFGL
jgi:hypothetical protein